MSVRETLPVILRGEDAADLTPSARERIDALAREAQEQGLLVMVRDECAARMRQVGASWAVELLLAETCAFNGEIERAHQTLLALGEKLAETKAWEPLAAVAELALGLTETHAAAHLLVRAHEGLGRDPERVSALERAWTLMPEDLELGLLYAIRLGEAGQGEDRRLVLTELMPRFAAEKRYAGLEEAALEFVEHQHVDGLTYLVGTLPVVAEQGALSECQQILAIAFPPIAAARRAGEVYAPLRQVVDRAIAASGPSAGDPFRAALVTALEAGPGVDLPDASAVIAAAGVADKHKPLADALERFDRIAALPPGRGVLHGSFGAGRLVSNDGEVVSIDFTRSKGHRMPYDAARRTLTALVEDDLRLLQLTDPQKLVTMRTDAQGEVLVRALRSLGGAADAEKLRVFLVGSGLLAAGEWTSFYRKARALVAKDPRVDSSRSFENQYRLAPERASDGSTPEVDLVLPPLQPRKSVKANLTTMRNFLAQHPGAETALAKRFGKFLERAFLDPEGELVDRARAGQYVARWFPERTSEWASALRDLWEQGLAVTDVPGEVEQLMLLEASHAAGVEGDAILSALDSRFAAVRDAAGRHRENLDAAGQKELRRAMLEHSPRYPAAAVRALDRELLVAEPPEDAWRLFWAALAMLEDRPKPSIAEKILGWLAPGGPYDRLLKGRECPESTELKLTVLLRGWRSSDRFLFPALEAAERLGLDEAVETVKDSRRQKSAKMFSQVGQQADVDLPVMTRATWARLKRELERLERELRTTIPATIQKARELGDLKENAEYHSAKMKQANVSKQVASLQLRLTRARFVDDVQVQDGVVGIGTEVVLESENGKTSFWILGEDEQHHGVNVISFQSPVGRALVGKSLGDEIDLDVDGARRRYRVRSVERKIPAAEIDEPHPSA